MTLQYRDLIHVETSCICSLWFMFEKHASSQKSCSVNKINTEIHSQQWSHLGNIHFLSDLLKHTSLSSFIYGSNESTIGSVILWRKKQHKPVPTSPLVETCSLASGKGLFLAEDRPRCWMKDSKWSILGIFFFLRVNFKSSMSPTWILDWKKNCKVCMVSVNLSILRLKTKRKDKKTTMTNSIRIRCISEMSYMPLCVTKW